MVHTGYDFDWNAMTTPMMNISAVLIPMAILFKVVKHTQLQSQGYPPTVPTIYGFVLTFLTMLVMAI